MAPSVAARSVTLVLLFVFHVFSIVGTYTIPEISIQPLKPRGVRISIPDEPIINLFAFQGQINRQIGEYNVGTISAEVRSPVDGRWTYQNDEVELKVGDVIYYNVTVNKDGKRYTDNGRSYFVKELDDVVVKTPWEQTSSMELPFKVYGVPLDRSVQQTIFQGLTDDDDPVSTCHPSATVTQNGTVCSGQIIFEDDFSLHTNLWTIEQYIPAGPEHPFVSYQRPPYVPTVSIDNGVLRIEPKLQQHLSGFNYEAIVTDGNVLDLTRGCTRPGFCNYINNGAQIMPPIVSGRLRSSTFAFKFGIIEVRAKLPKGDWLYPDILLEPVNKKYGIKNYDSGVLRIAGALGNVELNENFNRDYGNSVLYGGPIMNFKCRTKLLAKKISAVPWGDDFHTYSMRWAPDRITLMIDGVEWGRIETDAAGLHARLPENTCDPPRAHLREGSPVAPFDDLFYIVLGVAAGGISEFPDGMVTKNAVPKPWKNSSRKSKVDFLMNFDFWYSTWTQPEMLIDYVKVRAL